MKKLLLTLLFPIACFAQGVVINEQGAVQTLPTPGAGLNSVAGDRYGNQYVLPPVKGGDSIYRNLDLGTTGQVVKASAGQVHSYVLLNLGAATRCFKLYDKATAPTQADTPKVTLCLATTQGANTGGLNWQFDNGISMRCTTGLADNDTGAPTANDCVVAGLGYK